MELSRKTFDQALVAILKNERQGIEAWCKAHELNPRLIRRLRSGDKVSPHWGTITRIAYAMNCEEALVRKMIQRQQTDHARQSRQKTIERTKTATAQQMTLNRLASAT